MPIYSDDLNSGTGTHGACRAGDSGSATQIDEGHTGWESRIQRPDDLADKQKMQRAKIHRERRPLPCSVQRRVLVYTFAPMYIQRRERLNAASYFGKSQVFQM